jgi:Tol biopolymer transport system component
LITRGNPDIYSMSPGGTNLTRLTRSAIPKFQPAWSPDGKRIGGTMITFCSNRDGQFEIYVMNSDGSEQTGLTFNPKKDQFPDWQPV